MSSGEEEEPPAEQEQDRTDLWQATLQVHLPFHLFIFLKGDLSKQVRQNDRYSKQS